MEARRSLVSFGPLTGDEERKRPLRRAAAATAAAAEDAAKLAPAAGVTWGAAVTGAAAGVTFPFVGTPLFMVIVGPPIEGGIAL